MKKALLILAAAATLIGCTKTKNNILSVPKTGTEYIIDTSLSYGGSGLSRSNFIIYKNMHTGTGLTDTIWLAHTDTSIHCVQIITNWVNVGGSKFKAIFPGTVYEFLYVYNSGAGLDADKSLYLQIANGDTVNNFGH